MADEPKDRPVEGRGNLKELAIATNANRALQKLDSPELDVSLAMQAAFFAKAVEKRSLDKLCVKIAISMAELIERKYLPLTHPISPAVMAGVMYMAGYYAPLAAYRKS